MAKPKSASIHRLTGAGPITERQADVLAMAKDILRRAAAGEIKGMGIFLVDGADSVSTQWASGCARMSDMGYGSARLHHRVMCASDE